MTPAERIALARAMTAATGVEWRVAGRAGDPCADGVVRVARPFPGVVRVGDRLVLYGEGETRPLFTREQWALIGSNGEIPTHTTSIYEERAGRFSGRGWLPRFVTAAVVAVAAYDARPRAAQLSARDRRRVETYLRLLAADSGASDSERAQAAQHLTRLGVSP